MPKFSDAFLVLMIGKAARCVNLDLCITGTTSEIAVDASGCITPADGDLEALVLMKTECLISQRDYSADLNSGAVGINVVDGEQSIDTRNRATARTAFFDSKHGPCGTYADAIKIAKMCRFDDGKLVW